MKLDGCMLEAFTMSHDLMKNHGAFFYADSENIDNINITNPKILNIESLAVIIRNYIRKVKGNPTLEIEIEPISDFPQGDVSGSCKWIEEDNSYRIYFNNDLNDCWTRFVVCKELMQIYIDSNDSVKRYTQEEILIQIKELYEVRNIVPDNDNSLDFSEGVAPEVQAFIMAIDIIFKL